MYFSNHRRFRRFRVFVRKSALESIPRLGCAEYVNSGTTPAARLPASVPARIGLNPTSAADGRFNGPRFASN